MAKKTYKNVSAKNSLFELTSSVPSHPVSQMNNKKIKKNSKINKHYQGHRERLRKRYLKTKGNAIEDYEYLELLLSRTILRADIKPIAKNLLASFGSLADVLKADIHRLQEIEGCGPATAVDLKIISDVAGRLARAQLYKRDIFSSWDKVLAYCKAVMAHETREQFRVLFLDKRNGLISDEVQQTGTIDHTPVYPREVISRALELSASGLILIHNHPSGNASPSKADISMTYRLKDAANALEITIHDHIIIARNNYTSFKELKLI
ncbi:MULTISPECIES: RadC family protein [Bartonella]|uniref:DNA repair protein RadC n=1 Tax=Bartonella rochalimae ATCC BAA-1498 TaxID=685782 RepID=E6YLR7_9HYPH|nr:MULTISPECIES: DNA repair protein RadC [Bartonella]AQX18369.1 DNA repair protein RadC [Bartonella sp. A1379B]KEC56810.1 DNA repair protein RadC [Bartonella rochalimae ATCC BAA-1498]CBI77819.1 DNA repair protein RadC [Bartonella rochalimae ATCC BAA-1498]